MYVVIGDGVEEEQGAKKVTAFFGEGWFQECGKFFSSTWDSMH